MSAPFGEDGLVEGGVGGAPERRDALDPQGAGVEEALGCSVALGAIRVPAGAIVVGAGAGDRRAVLPAVGAVATVKVCAVGDGDSCH